MIKVLPDEDGKAIRVYHWKVLTDGRKEYTTYENRTKVVREGEKAPWWLVLSSEDAHALASELADWSGTEIPELGYYQGKLEAMSAHLEDMRSIAIPESLQ